MDDGGRGDSSVSRPLSWADQAALLSAFHHSGEIVVPNTFLPPEYRLTSMKAPPGRLSADARRMLIQTTARGLSAALAGRSRATPAYRHGNLRRLLDPGKDDPFAQYFAAAPDQGPSARPVAEQAGIPQAALQPDDWRKRVGHIPGGPLELRDTVGQGPYLKVAADQLGISPPTFPSSCTPTKRGPTWSRS